METPAADRVWRRTLEGVAVALADPHATMPFALDALAAAHGARAAIVSAGARLDFAELAARVNAVAHWGLSRGLGLGDRVALLSAAGPDMAVAWLGLTKIGAVVALVPPDLTGPPLAHALDASRAHWVLADVARREALRAVKPETMRALASSFESFVAECSLGPTAPPDLPANDRPSLNDPALLVYTSGTTGMPKAAIVSHARIVRTAHWFAGLAQMTSEDRLYNCLPLHHSVGGIGALLAPLVKGGSVVVAGGFSARRFWRDVADFDCTMIQYIGDLCRFLLRVEPGPPHRVRVAIGNGLSAEIWADFQARFAIPAILEFYASTEGNIALANLEGRIGSIGRAPRTHGSPAIALVKRDDENDAPLRGPDGLCAPCEAGEPGEALGRIARDSAAAIEGYTDGEASEKKLVHDVFAKGDVYWRSGDLLSRDAEGFYYFLDRLGDTFRWYGQNVACAEVEAALRAASCIEDCIVYGVAAPKSNGKAGMAALTLKGPLDLAAIAAAVVDLPHFARPLFLRIVGALEATQTFKPKRAALAAQGFDPGGVTDALYVHDSERDMYVALDAARFDAIQRSETRLHWARPKIVTLVRRPKEPS